MNKSTAEIGSKAFANAFTERLRSLLGGGNEPIALHEPEFAGDEWLHVKECLDTKWVSSVGKYVDQFEAKLAEITGVSHAVATINGTTALQLALIIAGVKPGDEVIVPALTFVATANAVVHAGAVPHFVDASFHTLGLDPRVLRAYLNDIADHHKGATIARKSGRRIAAVVPMHTFGHPVEMDELLRVAKEFNLIVIEDAAEALGSTYNGKPCGSMGDLGILSFNGNKIVTTGGGGAVLTDDKELARHAKHLSTTAKLPHKWAFVHDEIGFNFRLPNINAALGCAQLTCLDGFLKRKRNLAKCYSDGFAEFKGLSVVKEPKNATSNYWLNAIMLDEGTAVYRDAILEATNEAGLICRPTWTLMNKLPMFANYPCAALPVADAIEARLINIPSSAKLSN